MTNLAQNLTDTSRRYADRTAINLDATGIPCRRLGYRPRVCGFVANVSCSQTALERVERQLEQIRERDGRRVALIGHSRGGLYARALACRRSGLVSHAIALGAGLRQMLAISYPTQVFVDRVRRALLSSGRAQSPHCMTAERDCTFGRDMARPFPQERVRLSARDPHGEATWAR